MLYILTETELRDIKTKVSKEKQEHIDRLIKENGLMRTVMFDRLVGEQCVHNSDAPVRFSDCTYCPLYQIKEIELCNREKELPK